MAGRLEQCRVQVHSPLQVRHSRGAVWLSVAVGKLAGKFVMI